MPNKWRDVKGVAFFCGSYKNNTKNVPFIPNESEVALFISFVLGQLDSSIKSPRGVSVSFFSPRWYGFLCCHRNRVRFWEEEDSQFPSSDMAGGAFATAGPGRERAEQYKGKVTPYVAIACIVAAVGGSLFGYDIGISGKILFLAMNTILWMSSLNSGFDERIGTIDLIFSLKSKELFAYILKK